MRKIMIIPLIILIVVFTSFPVSAISSDNDVYIDFYCRLLKTGYQSSYAYMKYVNTGVLYYIRVNELVEYVDIDEDTGEVIGASTVASEKPTFGQLNIQFSCLSACDIWLCFPFSMDVSSFNDLSAYYDADSYFTGSQADCNAQDMTYTISGSSIESSVIMYTNPIDEAKTWHFYRFNDVPAGSYIVSFNRGNLFKHNDTQYPLSSGWYLGFGCIAEKLPDDSNSSSNPIGGGSGSGGSGEGNTYLDPWYSANSDLTTNLKSITDTLEAAIASASSVFEQIFYATYAQYQLDQIVFNSDQKNVQQTQVFNQSLSNVIQNFENGAVDYRGALDQMSSNYVNALQEAETPEQGEYITGVYQANQMELYAKALQDASEKVEEVVTEEDKETVNQYYEMEQEIFAQLDLQQLEDVLAFKNWMNLIDQTEAVTYRAILDFFVNDAVWKFWILVPFTFSIVGILLGTGVNMIGRSITITRMRERRNNSSK